MKILSLQPYCGGSHKYVMDALQQYSRHEWYVLQLPPKKWQWRMQHAALTFADWLTEPPHNNEAVDCGLAFCTDMMNLAAFRGLAPAWAAHLPTVIYFHENQFAYPARNSRQQKENAAYGFINMLSGVAADEVWFNSAHNRDSFLEGCRQHLDNAPDHPPQSACKVIRDKSRIVYPGIHLPPDNYWQNNVAGPLKIAWAARWEYDKGPEIFFQALDKLKTQGVDFRLSVLGEQFGKWPKIFDWAAEHFRDNIEAWGFEHSRERYYDWLQSSDVIVSTAHHEFFGISIMEGAACGAFPLLPDKLSYPELFPTCPEVFYNGTVENLAEKLKHIAANLKNPPNHDWLESISKTRETAQAFDWRTRVAEIDSRLDKILLTT